MGEEEKWGSGPFASQSLVVVSAACDSTVKAGHAVYLDPVRKVFKVARADTNSTSNALGVVSVKTGTKNCTVVFAGLITLDPLVDFVVGADYFLSDSALGGLSLVPPTSGGSTVLKMATALSKNVLIIKIALRLRRA